MRYLYGEFADRQIELNARLMHGEVHKLLLYKDRNITENLFKDDVEFLSYFHNLLYRFGGLNQLLGEPRQMVALMATLQAAYKEVQSEAYKWEDYRRLILDAHGYITAMFGEVSHA